MPKPRGWVPSPPPRTEPLRKIAFVLAPSDQGSLIVNRFDFRMVDSGRGIGVGFQLLEQGSYDPHEVATAVGLLALRRRYHGDGVVALDCGANIGVFTVSWARAMAGWGSVIAIEAQERLFYALAGNIALNNCFNARAIHAAVGATEGQLRIPVPDYLSPGTFGSLELRASTDAENIGQAIDYRDESLVPVRLLALDSLALPRLDLLKIDVEGMEIETLEGARQTIGRHLPVIVAERLKTPEAALDALLDSHGYRRFVSGLNIVAVHPSDPTVNHVRL